MPSKSLVATAKAMANESMALFSNRTNPINLNLATRMVTSALAQARKDSVQDAIASTSPISDVPYSMEELMAVLHPFKKSSPGEYGITYQVLVLQYFVSYKSMFLQNIFTHLWFELR